MFLRQLPIVALNAVQCQMLPYAAGTYSFFLWPNIFCIFCRDNKSLERFYANISVYPKNCLKFVFNKIYIFCRLKSAASEKTATTHFRQFRFYLHLTLALFCLLYINFGLHLLLFKVFYNLLHLRLCLITKIMSQTHPVFGRNATKNMQLHSTWDHKSLRAV